MSGYSNQWLKILLINIVNKLCNVYPRRCGNTVLKEKHSRIT